MINSVNLLNKNTMFVLVKTLTGHKLTLEIDEVTTFGNLKELISQKEGIEGPQIRLIYGGNMYADTQVISETKIKPGDIIHMVLSLRGG